MKKFVFNLEKVLQVRLSEEKVQQKALFIAESKLNELIQEMTNLFDKKKQMAADLAESEKMGFDGRTRKIYSEFNEKTDKMIEVVRNRIKGAEKEVSKERVKLLEIVKKRKSLENIKEKREEEHYQEQLKEDNKFMDEIGIGKEFAKRKG